MEIIQILHDYNETLKIQRGAKLLLTSDQVTAKFNQFLELLNVPDVVELVVNDTGSDITFGHSRQEILDDFNNTTCLINPSGCSWDLELLNLVSGTNNTESLNSTAKSKYKNICIKIIAKFRRYHELRIDNTLHSIIMANT